MKYSNNYELSIRDVQRGGAVLWPVKDLPSERMGHFKS